MHCKGKELMQLLWSPYTKDVSHSMWSYLEHSGPYYNHYVPLGTPKLLYCNKLTKLSPTAEVAAILYASIDESVKDSTFKKNFWSTWQPFLKGTGVSDLSLCNFANFRGITPKYTHCPSKSTCIVNSKTYQVSNPIIEPHCIFRGRGNHPRRGMFKAQVSPEGVTLNLAKNAPIPQAPRNHSWGAIVHNRRAMWLSTYVDSLGKRKYIYPILSSTTDRHKFDTARQLCKLLPFIRRHVSLLLKSKDDHDKQLGCVLWIIDNLCIRVGNEKDSLTSADTVGVCTIRVEHVKFVQPNKIRLTFPGKDSISYDNTCICPRVVYTIIHSLVNNKPHGKCIFEKIDSERVNTWLHNISPKVSARVFRTCHASAKFQYLLGKYCSKTDGDPVAYYKKCNEAVAVLCNHKQGDSICTSTSRLNYIDPRITYAYCKRHKISIGKVFSSAMQNVHDWASRTPHTFTF